MKKIIYIAFILMTIITNKSFAESIIKDNFQDPSEWKFISDNVMGGLSTGSTVYEMKEGKSSAYLSGNVSTENNGGFIQIRRNLKDIYWHDGVIDVVRAKTILKFKNVTGKNISYIKNSSEYLIDIDTMKDLKLTQLLLKEKIIKLNEY